MVKLLLSGDLRQTRDENFRSRSRLLSLYRSRTIVHLLALRVTDTVDPNLRGRSAIEVPDSLDGLLRCGNFDKTKGGVLVNGRLRCDELADRCHFVAFEQSLK